jgi:hypothetical protein
VRSAPRAALRKLCATRGLIVDVKSRLPRDAITAAGFKYWRV